MSSDYDRLKKLLKRRPYLVADAITNEVDLVKETDTFRSLMQANPFPTKCVVDAGKALEQFARLEDVGKADREFSVKQVAQIAGMKYHLCYHYMIRQVFVPSIREATGRGPGPGEARFSWADAFIIGLIGTLRRRGVQMDGLRKVSALFALHDTSRKRTARQLQTAERF